MHNYGDEVNIHSLKPQYIDVNEWKERSSLVFGRVCEVVAVELGFDEGWRVVTEGVLLIIHLQQTDHYRKEKRLKCVSKVGR